MIALKSGEFMFDGNDIYEAIVWLNGSDEFGDMLLACLQIDCYYSSLEECPMCFQHESWGAFLYNNPESGTMTLTVNLYHSQPPLQLLG